MFSKFVSFLVLLNFIFFNFNVAQAAYAPPTQNVAILGGPLNNANGAFIIPPSQYSSMLVLSGGIDSLTPNNFYGLYSQSSPGSNVQYQIPVGKTFYVLGIYSSGTAAGNRFQLGYGTAALAAEGTATPPTGVVYYSANGGVETSSLVVTGGAGSPGFFPMPISFPAGAYPFFRGSGSAEYRINLVGILQ